LLEEILTLKTKKNPTKIVLLSFFLTIVGFISAILIFPKHSSIAHVLITTILLMPILAREIKKEEKKESKVGLKRFYKNHKSIFEIFLLLFLGVFLAYAIITLVMVFFSNNIFITHDYQIKFIEDSEYLTTSLLNSNLSVLATTLKLVVQNLLLILVCFLLSLFYGSGGVFLIILNASIFATFLVESMKLSQDFKAFSLIFLIYLLFWFIPMTCAFLLSAIAGGVMSKAFMHEKFGSKRFDNVAKDAFVLFMTSLVVIVVGALLQVLFTKLVVGMV
tara:strand:- start:3128 stop:3955 length:828 start_codon:yes stop_codon:yes gene_type:complete